jgi:hypothetical protein
VRPGNSIERGQQGDSVTHLQEMLRERGFDVSVDGKFGPETEKAVRAFQAQNGLKQDGVVGSKTVGALGVPVEAPTVETTPGRQRRTGSQRSVGADPTPKAPTESQRQNPAPGTQKAADLVKEDELRRTKPETAGSVGKTAGVTGPADDRLADIQQKSVASAQKELAAGVKEDPSMGSNRGKRIDQYAKGNGMPPGGEWCGYFTGHNYTQAAKETGTKFSGQMRLHSFQKARSYFMYRNYTDNSKQTIAKDEALKQQHTSEGSARRYMTFQGSSGDKYATKNKLEHEVYTDAKDLPIRPGDTALFSHGHVGMVEGYDAKSGTLTTIEGNVGNKVVRKTYDLNDPEVRKKFDGFGRPAAGDFTPVP